MLSISEVFPTGKADHLDPTTNGTDATGTGPYQTSLDTNFKKLRELDDGHPLRSRLQLLPLVKQVKQHGATATDQHSATFHCDQPC